MCLAGSRRHRRRRRYPGDPTGELHHSPRHHLRGFSRASRSCSDPRSSAKSSRARHKHVNEDVPAAVTVALRGADSRRALSPKKSARKKSIHHLFGVRDERLGGRHGGSSFALVSSAGNAAPRAIRRRRPVGDVTLAGRLDRLLDALEYLRRFVPHRDDGFSTHDEVEGVRVGVALPHDDVSRLERFARRAPRRAVTSRRRRVARAAGELRNTSFCRFDSTATFPSRAAESRAVQLPYGAPEAETTLAVLGDSKRSEISPKMSPRDLEFTLTSTPFRRLRTSNSPPRRDTAYLRDRPRR